ncbi:hypothetical protein D3C87_1773790 [compost metagenome]
MRDLGVGFQCKNVAVLTLHALDVQADEVQIGNRARISIPIAPVSGGIVTPRAPEGIVGPRLVAA